MSYITSSVTDRKLMFVWQYELSSTRVDTLGTEFTNNPIWVECKPG